MIALVIALLLAFVTLQPWLSRYLPWRLGRGATRAGGAPGDPHRYRPVRWRHATACSRCERSAGLEYADLLEYTPDPLGDWAAGRHDALARAELASQGLDA